MVYNRQNYWVILCDELIMFYRSPSSKQGNFKMPAYKPPVPLEDVFSQVEAEFETSYLEVSD